MPRYIALLRGINVGGHRVKMTDLKRHFEDLDYTGIETFIASGNVVFESAITSVAKLEKQIGEHLRAKLGYDVPTFVRTPDELEQVARFEPFPNAGMTEGKHPLSVMFMSEPPRSETQVTLSSFETEIDRFLAHGREIYWLTGPRTSESLVDWPKLGKQLPQMTVRNVTTVRRMADKYRTA